MVDPNGTTFTVSGDMGMARGILDKWLGSGNYDLNNGEVSIKGGRTLDAIIHLTQYFEHNYIGAGSGSTGHAMASTAANWLIAMIGDPDRNVNMNVQNNGAMALEATGFTKGFGGQEIEINDRIESGMRAVRHLGEGLGLVLVAPKHIDDFDGAWGKVN